LGSSTQKTTGMTKFYKKMARNLAVDRVRAWDRRRRDFVDDCGDPDAYTPLEYGAEQRDAVDARRQLDVLAQLFRQMPEHGLDILEGIAGGCSMKEIAGDLGITERAVEGRLGTMPALSQSDGETRPAAPVAGAIRRPVGTRRDRSVA